MRVFLLDQSFDFGSVHLLCTGVILFIFVQNDSIRRPFCDKGSKELASRANRSSNSTGPTTNHRPPLIVARQAPPHPPPHPLRMPLRKSKVAVGLDHAGPPRPTLLRPRCNYQTCRIALAGKPKKKFQQWPKERHILIIEIVHPGDVQELTASAAGALAGDFPGRW